MFLNNISINNFIWTDESIQILKNMIKKNVLLNTIIYGANGSGKTTLGNIFLMDFFHIKDHKLSEYTINDKNILYTDYYYYIDANKYEIKAIRDIIQELSSNRCINNSFHTFIIDNINVKKKNDQLILKSFFENINNRFVLITSTLSKINDFFKSICIPVKLLYFDKKYLIPFTKKNFNNIKVSKTILYKLFDLANNNIKVFISKLKIYDIQKKIRYNTSDKICNKLINLASEKKIENLIEIDNILKKIKKKNSTQILKKVLHLLNTPKTIKLSDDKHFQIIKIASICDISQSLEFFFIELFNIFHNIK